MANRDTVSVLYDTTQCSQVRGLKKIRVFISSARFTTIITEITRASPGYYYSITLAIRAE